MLPTTRTVAAVAVSMGFGLVVLLGVFAMAQTRGVPVSDITYDSTSVLNAPVYVGSISRFTMMVWSAVGAQALLVAVLVPSRRLVMACFGTLTLLMAADDALRLHEGVGPRFGIPELAFYAFYAVAAFALLAYFIVRRSPAGMAYVIGAALLAVSVGADVIVPDEDASNLTVLLEDGSKLLGALVWVTVPALVALERRRSDSGTR